MDSLEVGVVFYSQDISPRVFVYWVRAILRVLKIEIFRILFWKNSGRLNILILYCDSGRKFYEIKHFNFFVNLERTLFVLKITNHGANERFLIFSAMFFTPPGSNLSKKKKFEIIAEGRCQIFSKKLTEQVVDVREDMFIEKTIFKKWSSSNASIRLLPCMTSY